MGDFAKRCVEAVSVGIQKLGMIKGVEELGAKFEQFRFGDGRTFQERDVPIVDARAAQTISSEIAERSEGSRREVTVGVECAIERRRIEIKVTADVAVRVGGFTGTICARTCECGDASRINLRYFPDQVRAIQKISLQAVVIV